MSKEVFLSSWVMVYQMLFHHILHHKIATFYTLSLVSLLLPGALPPSSSGLTLLFGADFLEDLLEMGEVGGVLQGAVEAVITLIQRVDIHLKFLAEKMCWNFPLEKLFVFYQNFRLFNEVLNEFAH